MMCDVPSMAVFCRESTECCPGIVYRYTVGIRVSTRQTREFSTFSVSSALKYICIPLAMYTRAQMT
jgi:hypothetical protein